MTPESKTIPPVTNIEDMTEALVPKTQPKLTYRLITGKDDNVFCERISTALAEGYRLYGSPAATFNGSDMMVAQAVVLDIAIDKNGAQR